MRYLRQAAVVIGLLVAVPASVAYAQTQTIIVERHNGNGSGKWESVAEDHQENDKGVRTHKLRCNNPGYSSASWTMAPHMKLVSYAEREIAAGNLTGSYAMTYQSILYHVEWSARDINNCLVIETQTANPDPGEHLPSTTASDIE